MPEGRTLRILTRSGRRCPVAHCQRDLCIYARIEVLQVCRCYMTRREDARLCAKEPDALAMTPPGGGRLENWRQRCWRCCRPPGSALSPGDVRDRLGGDLAYTTVVTILSRLHDKGS